MFNQAYSIINQLNSNFTKTVFNSFLTQWKQHGSFHDQVLHPTENQVEIAVMMLNHVLDLKFSVLTYDELVLLDSFCYQFKGIASVVFTPAVAFTLGFKAFFMLHEKSLIDHTPKSDFSSAVK